jgi:hypothetical protein
MMMMMMMLMVVLMGVQETGVFVAVCSSCRWWVTPTATSGDSLCCCCCCYCARVGPICFFRERESERARATRKRVETLLVPFSLSLSLSLSLAKCSLWMIPGPTRVISHPSAPYGCFSSHTRHLSSKNRPGGGGPGSRPVVTKQGKGRRTRGSSLNKSFVGTRV